jgi:hypothetical protein
VVGIEVLAVVAIKSTVLVDIMLCNPLKAKMEVTCSSFRMSLDFKQATQCYIPKDRTLYDISESRINHNLLVMKQMMQCVARNLLLLTFCELLVLN